MVGHHNARRSRLQGLFRPLDGHHALEDEGHLGVLDDLPQLGHRLGAGGGIQPLEEGQAGSVDIHGEHLRAGGLGLVQLGEESIPVPGLHSGDALAAVFTDGLGRRRKDGRVGSVAGEGGNAGLDAGGHQNLIVALVGELVAVVELYRPHRAGKDGQVIGLAEEREAGIHRAVGADGVHVQKDILPGVVISGGNGPRPLGAGAGHGVFAGPSAAHRARPAVRPAALPGGS